MSSSKSVPLRVFIGFLDGVVSKKDAESLARGFIERHGYALDRSSYGVTRYPGGFAYEVHEGGARKALLPDVLRRLDAGETVYINSGLRIVKIVKDERKGYQVLMMPEDEAPEATALKSGKRLTDWVQDRSGFLNFAAALMSISIVTLTCSIILAGAIGYVQSTEKIEAANRKFNDLPSLHWPSEVNENEVFVSKVVYAHKHWHQVNKPIPGPFDGMAIAPAKLKSLVESGGVLGVPASN